MIQIAPQMRIFLAVEPADFRKGIDGLAGLCRAVLKCDPFSGAIFVFRNRARKAIEILVYDSQGFRLCTKRLPRGDVPDALGISMRKGGSDSFVIFTTTGYPEGSRRAKEVLEVAVPSSEKRERRIRRKEKREAFRWGHEAGCVVLCAREGPSGSTAGSEEGRPGDRSRTGVKATFVKAALKAAVAYPRGLIESAASSLEEGLEETLALERLSVPESPRAHLPSTNSIENVFSRARSHARCPSGEAVESPPAGPRGPASARARSCGPWRRGSPHPVRPLAGGPRAYAPSPGRGCGASPRGRAPPRAACWPHSRFGASSARSPPAAKRKVENLSWRRSSWHTGGVPFRGTERELERSLRGAGSSDPARRGVFAGAMAERDRHGREARREARRLAPVGVCGKVREL